MAEVFVSPGVYTQEIDDTFSPPPGAAAIGAALVGYATKGPAFLPTTVNSFGQFRQRFGGLNPEFYMPYAAQSYLRNASTLSVTRVLGRGSVAAGTVGFLSFPKLSGYSISAVSGGCTVLGVIRKRTSGDGDILLSGTPSNFSLSAGGTVVTGLSMNEASGNYIKKVMGTDPQTSHTGEKLTDLYVDAVFDYDYSNVAGTVSGGSAAAGITLNHASITANGDAFDDVTGGFSAANSPWIVSQNAGGAVNNLFRFFTRSHGQIENNSIKVQVSNIQTSSSSFPEFTVAIRNAADDDRRPEILESYENVNLDPNSESYVGRVIGDRRVSYDLTQDPPELLFDGDFANKSKLVRIDMNTNGYPDDARPAGFRGVGSILAQCGGPSTGPAAGPGSSNTQGLTATVAALPTVTNQNRDGVIDKQKVLGINFASPGVGDRLKKTVTSASGSTTADAGMLFISTTGELSGSGSVTNFTLVNMVGSNSGNFVGSTTRRTTGLEDNEAVKFVSPVFSGWDGFDPRSNLLTDLNDGTVSGDFDVAKKTLANPEEVDFNLLAVPGVHSAGSGNPIGKFVDMVEQRADAFLLLDIANSTATGSGLALSVANAQDQAKKFDTSYAATYYPWIRINDGDNNRLVWVPPSVEVMGAYAFNDRVGQPWFAPAGFNRGGLERVLEVRRRLTQTQRDNLYNQRPGVNPIATFPGQGIVIFGQKTLQTKQSVLDRVNVRRMMLTVRKTISRMSRNFVFEQNNAATRSSLLNMVNGYLGSVQAANGINEFRASVEEGADLVDRNVIKGKIFLKPTSVAEIIIFDFTLTPQGASFSE
jgi:hypothetical protein